MPLAIRQAPGAWIAPPPVAIRERNLELRLALDGADVRAAQRLRFEVFNAEMNLGLVTSLARGIDMDPFDDHCDHLLVIDHDLGSKVVGTYRLMSWERVPSFGWYSESEFHMDTVKQSGMRLLELGRSCVALEHRTGRVINLLLLGIAEYMRHCGADALMGCASIHGDDLGHARRMSRYLSGNFASEPSLRVMPRRGFDLPPMDARDTNPLDEAAMFRMLPPLFKGYLRLGAKICGPPAWDRQFGTVDFFVLMRTRDLGERYRQRFYR